MGEPNVDLQGHAVALEPRLTQIKNSVLALRDECAALLAKMREEHLAADDGGWMAAAFRDIAVTADRAAAGMEREHAAWEDDYGETCQCIRDGREWTHRRLILAQAAHARARGDEDRAAAGEATTERWRKAVEADEDDDHLSLGELIRVVS